MSAISRRDFFGRTVSHAAVAGFLSTAAVELRANPLGLPIGSQTYPLRQRIKDGDFAGVCKDLAALGIQNLELCSPSYPEFASLSNGKQTRKILEDHGLKCPGAHFDMKVLRSNQSEMIAWAKDIGMTQMGTATLAPAHGAGGGRAQDAVITMDVVKKAADEYNQIAARAAKAGLQQYLHDEGFELTKVDGRLTYEVLLELLDPKLVKMQFQMSAMRIVGDPVMYFTKYPGRFISMHLQGVDLKAPQVPVAPGGRGGRGGGGGLAVGKDSVDWAKVFTAAKVGGVKNYFLEQSWDLTVQSVAYLKTLKV
jgi:sugar phosphate isomerase/epimerase